ncbi:MAG TPA: hypothetical protein ENN69_02365 [Spirochaetia bacterium]|nr:hypothetical protein [Spirochaetia bacterium]
MLKKIVQNYLSSNTDFSNDSILRLKFTIVNAFASIGVSYVFVHGLFNLIRQYSILGGLELMGGFMVIINVLLLRRTKNIEFAGSVILFLMLCLFVSLMTFGQNDKTGLFWFFTFPLLAFFLKSRKKGFIWIAVQFVIIVLLFGMSWLGLFIQVPYTFYEMIILIFSLLAVILIVYFYDLLKDEFVRMQERRQDELIEKKIVSDQFQIAEQIQTLLIPQEDAAFGNIAISGFYKAASGVGGDYYDFFEVDKRHVAVIVSDVAGKGLSSAFVMVNIRSIFQHNIVNSGMSPADMVKLINRKMLEDSTNDLFATLSVYLFDSERREVVFCHAGYGPFVFYSFDEDRVIELPTESLPAGVVAEDTKYVNIRQELAPGDIILSYTDGLLESFEKKYDNRGKEKLYQLLLSHAPEDPRKIKHVIINEIDDYIGNRNQRDDISLVIAKIE